MENTDRYTTLVAEFKMGDCCCTPPPDPPPRGACCYIDDLGSLRCANSVLEIDCFTKYNQSSFSSEVACGEKIICAREGDSISPVNIYKGDDFYIVKSNDDYYYWQASLNEENILYVGEQIQRQLYSSSNFLQGNLKDQILFDRSLYAYKRDRLGTDGIWSTTKDSDRSFSFASLRSDKTLYIKNAYEFFYPAYVYKTFQRLFPDPRAGGEHQLIAYDQDFKANNQTWTDSKFKDFAMTSTEGKELCGAIAAIYDESHFDASKRGKVFTIGSYTNGACPLATGDIGNIPLNVSQDYIDNDLRFVQNRIDNINSIENASGIIANNKAFLVLKKDGKPTSFGDRDSGGDLFFLGEYKFINSSRGPFSFEDSVAELVYGAGIYAQSGTEGVTTNNSTFLVSTNTYSDIYRSYEHFFVYNSESKEGSVLGITRNQSYYNTNSRATQNLLIIINRFASYQDLFIGIEKVIPLHSNFLLLGSSTYRVCGKHINGHNREFNIPEGASSVVKAVDSNSYIIILWDNGKCSIEFLNKNLYGGNKSYFNNVSLDSTSSSDSYLTNKVIDNVIDIFGAEECYAILYSDNKLEICFKEGNDSGYLPSTSTDPYFTVSDIEGSDGVYKLYTFENVIDCRLGSTFSFPFDQKQTVFESKKTQTISVFRKTDAIVLGRYSNTGHYSSSTENFKVVQEKLFPLAFNENYGSVFNYIGEEKSLYQRSLYGQDPSISTYESISQFVNNKYPYPIVFIPGQYDYAFEACGTRCNTTLLQCDHLTGETRIPTDGVYSSDFPNSVVNSPLDCTPNTQSCCGIYVRNTDGRLVYINTFRASDKNLCAPPESVQINGKTYTNTNSTISSKLLDIVEPNPISNIGSVCYRDSNDLFPNLEAPFARGPNDRTLYPKVGTGDKIIISPSIFGGEVTSDGKCFLFLDYFQIDGSHNFNSSYQYKVRVDGVAAGYFSDGTSAGSNPYIYTASVPVEDIVEPISGRVVLEMRVPYPYDYVDILLYSMYIYRVDDTTVNFNDNIISNVSKREYPYNPVFSQRGYIDLPDNPYWRTPNIDNKYIKRHQLPKDYGTRYRTISPIKVQIYRGDFYDV